MIKGKKKGELFDRIKRLLTSKIDCDYEIGRLLLISQMGEFSWLQFKHLVYVADCNGDGVSMEEIHKYNYDKRQQEREANQRNNTQESQ